MEELGGHNAAWLSAEACATKQPDQAVIPMRYAILCYHDQKVTCACSQEHDESVMAKLAVVHEKLARRASSRLLPPRPEPCARTANRRW